MGERLAQVLERRAEFGDVYGDVVEWAGGVSEQLAYGADWAGVGVLGVLEQCGDLEQLESHSGGAVAEHRAAGVEAARSAWSDRPLGATRARACGGRVVRRDAPARAAQANGPRPLDQRSRQPALPGRVGWGFAVGASFPFVGCVWSTRSAVGTVAVAAYKPVTKR